MNWKSRPVRRLPKTATNGSTSIIVDDAVLVDARVELHRATLAVESSQRSVEFEARRLTEIRRLLERVAA